MKKKTLCEWKEHLHRVFFYKEGGIKDQVISCDNIQLLRSTSYGRLKVIYRYSPPRK